MKRFFEENDGEPWTREALDLENEVQEVLKPIFQKYASKGYSIREIAHIASGAVATSECEMILDTRCKKKVDNKEEES